MSFDTLLIFGAKKLKIFLLEMNAVRFTNWQMILFERFSNTVKVFKQLDSYAQKEWFLRRIGNWPCCENKESRAIFSTAAGWGLNNLDFTIIFLIKSFWLWLCEIIRVINDICRKLYWHLWIPCALQKPSWVMTDECTATGCG